MSTPNMNLVLPVDHGSADIWDAVLDTVFGLVDAHDHTPGKGALVPSAGIKIDADISWSFGGVSRAITDLRAIDFSPQPAAGMTALTGAFFLSDGTGGLAVGELYYRTVLGTNVQVTLGAALNVAAFSGGIGGDYISAGALESYDAATLSFWLQQPGAPRPWARLRTGDVDIYQTAASIVNRVRLQSPAALAASYALTLLTALPGSQQILQVTAAGQLLATNTIAQAVTIQAPLTMSVNQSIALSGTANYQHSGLRTITRPLALTSPCEIQTGGLTHVAGAAGVLLQNNSIIFFALPEFPTYWRIVNVSIYFGSAADRTACTCVIFATNNGDPVNSTFTTTGIPLLNSGTAISKATSANLTSLGLSSTYWVQVSNSVSTPRLAAIVVDYDVP